MPEKILTENGKSSADKKSSAGLNPSSKSGYEREARVINNREFNIFCNLPHIR